MKSYSFPIQSSIDFYLNILSKRKKKKLWSKGKKKLQNWKKYISWQPFSQIFACFNLKNFNFPPNKTRPSLDLEAATMYKLKGQSSNLQTGQSFKEENWSVRLAYPSSGFFLLALLKSFSMNLTTLTIL